MKENANTIRTGFYLEKNWLQLIENIKDSQFDNKFLNEEEYWENARIFLDGICNLFAHALKKRFGYDIYKLVDAKGNGIHWFCMTNYNGVKLYIDVIGITSDKSEFLSHHFIKNDVSIKKDDDISYKEYKFYKEGLSFANKIINDNKSFYNIDLIGHI